VIEILIKIENDEIQDGNKTENEKPTSLGSLFIEGGMISSSTGRKWSGNMVCEAYVG
jgi:hypothetical protein